MAALTPVASEVQADPTAQFFDGWSGQAIAAGAAVAFWSGIVMPATNVEAQHAGVKGIAVNPTSAANQRVRAQIRGSVTMGARAGVVQGKAYYVGLTPGSIVPEADLASGQQVAPVGYGGPLNTIILGPKLVGVAKP